MSWAEMQKMGYARIICDTSTMTVGDTIRVKSVYNPTQYMDKQVVTVGTPIVFDLGFIKDYVKICMVQTINNVETEVGGVYKTLDYGQTIYVDNMFDKSTLRGVQGILDSHNENQLNIGDSVFMNIQGGNKWETLVGAINPYSSHEVILVSKYLYDSTFTFVANHTAKRNAETAFYNLISADDKALLKDKQVNAGTYPNGSTAMVYTSKVWSPTSYELFGAIASQSSFEAENNVQFAIFTSQVNRVKSVINGSPTHYATSSNAISWADVQVIFMGTSGSNNYTTSLANCRVLPCFRLTAGV